MKVKLRTPRVLASGRTQRFGEVIDLPAEEARRLIDAKQALPLPLPQTGEHDPPKPQRSRR
jgi:hypothetical protein